MSWKSGSAIATNLIRSVMSTIDDPESRKQFYLEMIDTFESYDCDTLGECLGHDEAFDLAYLELYPEIEFEEDDE